MLVLNDALAAGLGADPDALHCRDGVALLLGTGVPDRLPTVAQGYAGHQFGSWSPRLGDGRGMRIAQAPDGHLDPLQPSSVNRSSSYAAPSMIGSAPMLITVYPRLLPAIAAVVASSRSAASTDGRDPDTIPEATGLAICRTATAKPRARGSPEPLFDDRWVPDTLTGRRASGRNAPSDRL
jgi:Protein adenylyltransferase SelO